MWQLFMEYCTTGRISADHSRYLLFVAFPIIFEGILFLRLLLILEQRGWGPGIGGLAFIGKTSFYYI
jgi:hypothetical protein